jgi:hypothetical protein
MVKTDLKKMAVRGWRKVFRDRNTWKLVQPVNHVEGNNPDCNNRSEQTHREGKL